MIESIEEIDAIDMTRELSCALELSTCLSSRPQTPLTF